MVLVPIFVDEKSGRGLYSIQYGAGRDEFSRLMEIWQDTLYVSDYCNKNIDYILTEYFEGHSIDEIIEQILIEARTIEGLLIKYTKDGFAENSENLQYLFKPLDDMAISLYVHQESKASAIKNRKLGPILRIYAVRISENTYVISGGAIKLTHKMQEHDDTNNELKKLKKVKNFLINNGFDTEEELKIIL